MNPAALYLLYAALALGAVGLFACLPSPAPTTARWRRAGAVLAAAALAVVATYWTRWLGPASGGQAFFVIFAVIAVAAAARVITHPRPVYSALYFVLVVLAVTGLCLLAAAEFLAAALVIVYAGAILVTYVFVIMLAQQGPAAPYDRHAREPLAAAVLGFALAAAAMHAMAWTGDSATARMAQMAYPSATAPQVGNPRAIGQTLLTTHVMALEVAGVLLLVAMVGAVMIVRKRIEPEALTPAEREPPAQDLHRRGRDAAPF